MSVADYIDIVILVLCALMTGLLVFAHARHK